MEVAYKDYRVLLVDDEVKNLRALLLELRSDFDVVAAGDVETAHAILKEQKIATVVCDQRMPEVTGVEFLTKVGSEHPAVVRVLITAYADIDAVIAAINEGHVYRYISKTAPYAQVARAIKDAIDRYHLFAETERLAELQRQNERRLFAEQRVSALGEFGLVLNDQVSRAYVDLQDAIEIGAHRKDETSEQGGAGETALYKGMRRLAGISTAMQRLAEVSNYQRDQRARVFREDLNTAIQRSVDLFGVSAKELVLSGAVLDLELDDRIPAFQYFYDTFNIALRELLQNACHAISALTPADWIAQPTRKIVVRTRLGEEHGQAVARVQVVDDGCGMSAGDLVKALTPFHSGPAFGRRTGLGLNVVEQVILRHGGHMAIESQEGAGTTVTVSLPIDSSLRP